MVQSFNGSMTQSVNDSSRTDSRPQRRFGLFALSSADALLAFSAGCRLGEMIDHLHKIAGTPPLLLTPLHRHCSV